MFRPNMRPVSAYFAIALLSSTLAIAGEKDFELPIKVDSQSNFFDGKTKTSIFRKDVKITQGSLEIIADEVTVSAVDGEGKEVFIARGTPASYKQQLDDGSEISAAANEIRYEVSSRILTLQGKAELKQDSSQVNGDSIVFNMALEQLIAQGSESENGGVTTIFQPDSLRKADKEDDTVPSDSSSEEDKP